jgi:YHS domain-containing protein
MAWGPIKKINRKVIESLNESTERVCRKKEITMNGKRKSLQMMLGVVGTALVLLLLAQGCKKEKPTAKQTQPSQTAAKSQTDQMSAMAEKTAETAKETAETAKETATETADQVMAAAEQKTCPVMDGNPIDKNIFVEYKGKKVYFCCTACKEKFLADPEKYIAKLPQFKQ